MAQPLTVKRNNYKKNKKPSNIETPASICKFLYDIITAEYPNIKLIVDPTAGNSNLTHFFRKNIKLLRVIEYETDKKRSAFWYGYGNFFYAKCSLLHPDLVVCNPPFNGFGNKLGSEVFLKKIVELFSNKVKIVLFVPMGFRLNQKKTSRRYRWLMKTNLEITSIISLPLDIFKDVQFHSEILCFNMPKLKPHYWLP